MLTLDQLAAEVTRATGGDLLAVFASPAAPGDVAHRVRRDDLFAFGQGQKCFAFGVAGNPACLGDENTAGGWESMGKVTGQAGDGRNTSWGSGSLHELTTGTINTADGYNCCYHLTTGQGNTGTGAGTLGFITGGSFNAAHGSAAMENMDLLGGRSSSYNAAVGYASMYLSNGHGANFCTCLGAWSGAFIQDSVGHVLIGYFAGWQDFGMAGSYNTLVGYQTKIEAADTAHAVALGDQAVGRGRCLTVSPSLLRAYLPLLITAQAAAVPQAWLDNSQMAYWLEDDPAGAAVHFVAKDSTGNVWQARLPLSR